MKLDNKEYAEFLKLKKLFEAGKLDTDKDKKRFAELSAKKEQGRTAGNTPNGKQDVHWYLKYAQLMKDASNVVFNEISGRPFVYDYYRQTAGSKTLPVGYVIHHGFFPGKCADATSNFNYLMRALYLAMHRKYRGIGKYEYCDLGITMWAIFGFMADVGRAKRIYGSLRKYNVYNRSVPEVLVKALGLTANYQADQIADFRYQLNALIEKSKRFCLPAGFSALEAMFAISSQIFKDADQNRAAWYLYENDYKMVYSPTKYTTGGCVEYKTRTRTGSNGTQTLTDIINDLVEQANALLNDDDIAQMCSDILACFGENGVVTVAPIAEDFTVEIVNSEERKVQLHNTSLVGYISGVNIDPAVQSAMSNFGLDLYQNGGIVRQEIGCSSVHQSTPTMHVDSQSGQAFYGISGTTYLVYTGDNVLDTWKDQVSDDDVVEMVQQACPVSRKQFPSANNATITTHIVDSYSLVVCSHLTSFSSDGSASADVDQSFHIPTSTGVDLTNFYQSIRDISKLDWAPICHLIKKGAGGGAPYDEEGLVGDIDHYSHIERTALSRIHEVSVLSAFKVEDSAFAVMDQGEKDSGKKRR